MRFSLSLASSFLLLAAGAAQAASWSFDEGSIAVTAKKGDSASTKEKLDPKTPLAKPVVLGGADTAKITLTAKDGGKARRPHQAFLLLREEETGLEAPFPLSVKENGKGSVQISQKDIPAQLLLAKKPLRASVVIASFGSDEGLLSAPLFDITVETDPNAAPAAPSAEASERYGRKPEIHHIFRADPRSPPRVISLFFAAAVLAAVPALFIGWAVLGANLGHLQKALGAAPLSHATFFGSILAMEGVFFMYYSSWNLFQTLPVVGLVGAVAVLSGSKALGEVQSRRLAGER